MRSVVNERESSFPLSFPKLMVAQSGCVVLFVEKFAGVCVSPGETLNIVGEYISSWNHEVFSDFHGSVTLSNGG